MAWITLIGLASFVSAGNSILDKRLMKGGTVHPLACTASFGIVSLPVAIIGLLMLPRIPWLPAAEALLAGLVYVAAVWLYYRVVGREDISLIVPLMRLSAIQTLIGGAIVLGDHLNAREFVAFVIFLLSSMMLSLRSSGGGKLRFGKSVVLAVLPVTTLLALNSVLLAAAYQNPSTTLWHGQAWEAAGMAAGCFAIAIAALPANRTLLLTSANRRGWGVLLGEQTIRTVTGIAPAWAMTQRIPVALISAANGLNPLCVWVLASMFLGERGSSREALFKASGIIGTVVAVYLLS